MTFEQIEWARSHDWFICDNGDGSVTVQDEDCDTVFSDFKALKEWAGY